MWKAVNHPNKTDQALSQCSGMAYDAVGSKGGDLNIHGSAEFNKVFFSIWQNDGYPDYVILHVNPTERAEFALTKGTQRAQEVTRRYSVAGNKKRTSFWSTELDEVEEQSQPNDILITLKVSDLRQLFQKNKRLAEQLLKEIQNISNL